MTATLFPEVAATLVANGYKPVPITPGKKFPWFGGWETFAYSPGCEARYPKHGAGVILGEVVGVDIDIECPDAAAAVETAVREILHIDDAAAIPRRTGRAPRVLLPLRCEAPFAKLVTAEFRMQSCPDAEKNSKVEVLAQGQQFVAYHVHPETHRAYAWNGGGDLLTVPRDQLPEITEAQAGEIVRQAEAILGEWGERVVKKPDDNAQGATPGADIPDGARDDTLYLMGRKMHYAGFDEPAILAALADYNRNHCKPPKEDSEIRRIAHSCATGEDRQDKRAPPLDLLRPMAAPPLRADDVPAVLAQFAVAQARATGFDVSILLAAGIAAACATLSDQIRLLVAPRSEWFESPRLWLAIVGGPGAGKPPGSKSSLAPVFAIHREGIGAWMAANEDKDESDRDPQPVVYVNDATTEALADVLRDNERGVLYFCDELESWLGQHDAYRSAGGGKDRGEWLRLYDGGPHQVNRVKRGAFFVANWGVSLLSATTPAALRKMAPKPPDDGLLQRFMLVLATPMASPEATMLRVETRQPTDAWDSSLRRLHTLPACTVRLSCAASEAFAREKVELHGLTMAYEDSHPAFAAHVAKRSAMLARLALVFHALESPAIAADVTGETMERAARFMRQERHAHAIYGAPLGLATGIMLAKDIARAILASRLDSFNRRELTPRCKAFRAADEPTRHAALTLLADCKWLTVDAPTLGHGAHWLVDARVHELFAEHGEAARNRRELVRSRIAAEANDEPA